MKIALLLFCIVLTPIYSQDLKTQITQEICDCMKTISINEELSTIRINAKECFANTVKKNIVQIREEAPSQEAYSKFYDELVSKVQYCSPHVYNLLKRLFQETINSQLPATQIDSLFENWSEEKVKVSKNPVDFKIGKFKMTSPEMDYSILIKGGEFQFEVLPGINDTMTFSIKWINEYEYDLTYLGNKTEYNLMTKGHVFKIRIFEITDNSFVSFTKNISVPGSRAYKNEFLKIE